MGAVARLEVDSGAAANLTAELAVGEYTAAGAFERVAASLRLSNLNAAAASFVAVLRHKGAGGDLIREYAFADNKRTSTDTAWGCDFPAHYLTAGEKLEVRLLSTNASDTNVTWQVEWFDAAQASAVVGAVGSVTAAVTAGTVSDKTGYSLSPSSLASVATYVWTESARTLTGFGTLVADVAAAVWAAATRTLTAFGFAVSLGGSQATQLAGLHAGALWQPCYLVGAGALTPLLFRMSAAGLAGVTVELSKAGGAFAAAAGVVAEVGGCWYRLAPTAADTDTAGPLVLLATHGGTGEVRSATFMVFEDPDLADEFAAIPAAVEAQLTDEFAAVEAGIGTACPGASAGAVQVTFTLTRADETPIAGAAVWVTTDAAGLHVVDSATSDAFGKVTMLLDAGDYYRWVKASGVQSIEADPFTVPAE